MLLRLLGVVVVVRRPSLVVRLNDAALAPVRGRLLLLLVVSGAFGVGVLARTMLPIRGSAPFPTVTFWYIVAAI